MRTLRKLLIFLVLIAFISAVSAVTITNQASLKNTGPNIGFKNKGTIQASDLYATDDAKVGDDLQVVGELTVGGVIIPQEMAVPFSYDANSVDIGIFSAKGAWNITAVELVPRVAGNDAGAVNVTIKVCDSGEAPSSGEAALSAVLNLKGTADTPQSGTLGSNVACTATQFIALDFNGTLTNAVGMGTVWLKRV